MLLFWRKSGFVVRENKEEEKGERERGNRFTWSGEIKEKMRKGL